MRLVTFVWPLVCDIAVHDSSTGARRAGQKAVVERRKNERVPLAIPVFVRGSDSEGKEFLEFATALNISASGALLATRRYVPRLSTISLEIPSAPLPRNEVLPHAVRRLRARLLRITTRDGYQLWGLKFTSSLLPRKKK